MRPGAAAVRHPAPPPDPGASLEAFLVARLGGSGDALEGRDPESTLLRALARSVVPSGPEAGWRRRPSISHDGTPILLSSKLSRSRADELRVIVESGSLGMTVAEQIAFSLSMLDRLLGQLSWREAAAAVNTVTAAVLPADPAATREWWGGIWLGASVPTSAPGSDSAELRMYLNLRNGDAHERWERLAGLLAAFHDPASGAMVEQWVARVSPHSIPVGLGAVVAAGRLGAIRVYVAASSSEVLVPLCRPVSEPGERALVLARDSFLAEFAVSASRAVTLGYDFLLDASGALVPRIGRVKVELSFQGVAAERRAAVVPWVERLAADWSLEPGSLHAFADAVVGHWGGYEVSHVSLGFAPGPDHVTVYAKPGR